MPFNERAKAHVSRIDREHNRDDLCSGAGRLRLATTLRKTRHAAFVLVSDFVAAVTTLDEARVHHPQLRTKSSKHHGSNLAAVFFASDARRDSAFRDNMSLLRLLRAASRARLEKSDLRSVRTIARN